MRRLALPRRLRSLTILFSGAFLAATIGTGVAVYSSTTTAIAELVDRRIAAESSVAAGPPGQQSAGEILARIEVLATQRHTGDIGFELEDAAGRRLGGNIDLRPELPVGGSTLRGDAGIRGLTHGRALVRRLENGLQLTAVAETEPFDGYDATRVRIYLAGFGSIVLVVLAGMVAFGLLVHRRIADTRRTVAAIIDGDMQQRVPIVGTGGEFDRQALAFNRMLDRIAELMAGLRNVSSDVAHDLRTPLARLRSQLTALLRRADTPELGDGIEAAIAQCDELLAIFAAVLRIAEVEGGDRRAAFATIDLSRLAADIGEMMQPVVTETGQRLTIGPCDAADIRGDRQSIVQALINLIDNATHHTPAGTSIHLSVTASDAAALVRIADDGVGIPAGQRALAMRRFGRLDGSRNTSGHGLGLPLVDAIARLHQGSVELADAGPGLSVTMKLPLA